MNENGTEQKEGPFFNLALRYRDTLKPLLAIYNHTEYRNVLRHSLVVAQVCDELAELLGLDSHTHEALVRGGFQHDEEKILELQGMSLDDEKRQKLKQSLDNLNSDQNLLAITKDRAAIEKFKNPDRLTLPQMILYYADAIVSWDQIKPLEERIEDSKIRRKELPRDFFYKELKFAKEVENKIFNLLPESVRAKIEKPSGIPNYLSEKLAKSKSAIKPV